MREQFFILWTSNSFWNEARFCDSGETIMEKSVIHSNMQQNAYERKKRCHLKLSKIECCVFVCIAETDTFVLHSKRWVMFFFSHHAGNRARFSGEKCSFLSHRTKRHINVQTVISITVSVGYLFTYSLTHTHCVVYFIICAPLWIKLNQVYRNWGRNSKRVSEYNNIMCTIISWPSNIRYSWVCVFVCEYYGQNQSICYLSTFNLLNRFQWTEMWLTYFSPSAFYI